MWYIKFLGSLVIFSLFPQEGYDPALGAEVVGARAEAALGAAVCTGS